MTLLKHAPQVLKQSDIYKELTRKRRVWSLRKQISTAKPLKVVLGACPTDFPGWVKTDKELLDVTSPSHWSSLFEPDSIDLLLSEHMLEHLTENEAKTALHECYRYLKPGGLFRVAVPDGYRRDPIYVTEASYAEAGHQVVYNVDTLTALLQSVGFNTTPLEYFDAQEQFRVTSWDVNEGFIKRSVRFDTQQDFQRGNMFYTSLIVDAKK